MNEERRTAQSIQILPNRWYNEGIENNNIEKQSLEEREIARLVSNHISDALVPECRKEMALGSQLVSILCETELPDYFEVTDITSVVNDSVKSKFEKIQEVPQLQQVSIIPEYMTKDYPIAFDKETLEKAPWVNMVHAWMKVLNYSNTISQMQLGAVREDMVPPVLAAIVQELYAFTTESDEKYFSRTSKQFKKQEKYPETILRELGSKGVNSQRHVAFEEMRYILQMVREAFAKK